MLRHLTEAKGIAQIELHRRTKIAKSTLSEVLAEKRAFTRNMIRTLAEFFDVDKSVAGGQSLAIRANSLAACQLGASQAENTFGGWAIGMNPSLDVFGKEGESHRPFDQSVVGEQSQSTQRISNQI